MRIKRLTIDKLFEVLDYDISFNDENLLIVTGPNGFGKTMLLNIIFNLFNKRFAFFQRLVFEKVVVGLEDEIVITIVKTVEVEKPSIKISFSQNGKKIESIEYSNKLEVDLERHLQRYFPIAKISDGQWIDHRTETVVSSDDILLEFGEQLPEKVRNGIFKIKSQKVNEILDSIKVHLIREQRLFRKVQNNERHYREDKDQSIMIETIQTYAKELKLHISQNSQQSFKISQDLDSSYPDRLVKEKGTLTEEEYTNRFDKLKTKQEKLAKNGLYERKQQFLGYSREDSKALLVYLNDLEQKLGVFDNLLEKLELFTGILNDRRFTFKEIQVDREKGFYFRTSAGKILELKELSSGEQHEVVLLYELIFNTKQNILVLIDEPEISLHISWQKDFLSDLLKIIKIQNIQVVIATHSPSIINDRWDLVYNLEKKRASEKV